MIRSIGPGLYARTNEKPNLLDQYRAKQTACPHEKRDPRGVCYRCGQKSPKAEGK
jgi:hypothetical protein